MGSSFNPQILVDKLAKLNMSQASIETLSHWCIFHMNKAKQVVETWARQFHCAPREQRLAFLYLANDILQNSRRKGAEFVGEFWKVLPDALRDVIKNGDEYGRNSAKRLVGIWEDRKVFGSSGQILKEELVGRQLDNGNWNGKPNGSKPKPPAGSTMDKIFAGYQVVYGGQVDEDAVLNKCRNAIICIEKVNKEIGSDVNSGQLHGSARLEEVEGQHAVVRDCIGRLTALESSRASLVVHLREALQEEEYKLEQVRNQLQAAHSQSEQADNICRQLLNNDNHQALPEKSSKEPHTSTAPQSFVPVNKEQSIPVMYSGPIEEDPRKSAAAAVAAKLTASTSSAEMLSYVLSSLASESVIGNSTKEDYPPEKRQKLDADQPYIHTSQNVTTPNEVPPPPSSPPPLPPQPPVVPYPVPPYVPGLSNGVSFTYTTTQQPLPSLLGFPAAGAPMTGMSTFTTRQTNSYETFQGSEGFYGQQSSMPTLPISRP